MKEKPVKYYYYFFGQCLSKQAARGRPNVTFADAVWRWRDMNAKEVNAARFKKYLDKRGKML